MTKFASQKNGIAVQLDGRRGHKVKKIALKPKNAAIKGVSWRASARCAAIFAGSEFFFVLLRSLAAAARCIVAHVDASCRTVARSD